MSFVERHPRVKRTLEEVPAGLSLVLLSSVVLYFLVTFFMYYSGIGVGKELHCEEGQTPASSSGGAVACFASSTDLPSRWSPHPLGNRPLECKQLRGWDEVVKKSNGKRDCLATDKELPSGYRYVKKEAKPT